MKTINIQDSEIGQEVNINGKIYYKDFLGNLISKDCIREKGEKINTPKTIFPLMMTERMDLQESFVVFTLDGNNQIINKHVVTRGLVNSCKVHCRETFYPAIKDMAVSIIVAHNHPSGNLEESDADIFITKKLIEASKILGIPVLDHVIVTKLGFSSLREKYPQYFH